MKIYLEKQHKNLSNGKAVNLKIDHLTGKKGVPLDIKLHPSVEREIKKRIKSGKGIRLQLSDSEIEGSGIKEFFQKGFDWYKKNVKDDLGPLIRKGLKKGIEKLGDFGEATLAPIIGTEGVEKLEALAKRGVDKLGDKTGAYGLVRLSPLDSYYSDFLAVNSPAMHPMVYRGFSSTGSLNQPFEGIVVRDSGGSFKALGGSFRA